MEPEHRSCSDPTHRALDLANKERGKSFFQLTRCLQNARISHLSNSISLGAEIEPEGEDLNNDEGPCDAKSPTGDRKLKAKWARSQTHNEQLIVRPCGVILARKTFFASEGVIQVKMRPVKLSKSAACPNIQILEILTAHLCCKRTASRSYIL